ncbi:translation initiation factor IF-2 [Xanthomonas graminis]|jgi:translation initiation factor IF-2|uniref:Translation initiation factor IF-2 n=2 Tax=Xanthomonas translucens group TaxID=3390202 RepID=A0A1M4L628_9XANT|nr:translation initiation factor IF-2 [Xanthomonas translucens]OAX62674.1 translation initiation factor IF-2 [Xanthomonas translucens pv. graminis]UKE55464.1 translation initiation factor IF-2 [Xanthomonas translucens pv. graminis]WIH09839.1 translation initiation factor IF-2 [Xanthomonas translucens pv. graminis]WIH11427.1 translation initiation factor IF-2 [Xanthomonas translucens pv. graminis]WIH15076.1 translation initiation factor IF-2 [Xanthomonas translucens pv. graminis]
MSQQTTIRKLAELVNTPVDKLLVQLAQAGMKFSGPDQVVTSTEKMKLLGFLRRTHGKTDKPVEEQAQAAPKKITLNRRKLQEVTVSAGRSKTTVNVEVRQKRTYVKTAEDLAAERAGMSSGGRVDDERAEILRKLEASKQRNLAEQQKLAEQDRARAEEIQRKRQAEQDARDRVEAERKAALEAESAPPAAAATAAPAATPNAAAGTTTATATGAAAAPRAPRPAGAPHHPPKPAAPRSDDRNNTGNKHKTRGSHVMVAGVEDDDSTSRFAGQLHLSAADRARRSNVRGKPRGGNSGGRRQPEPSRSGGGAHGFERPTAPVVREVAIGETITVADLAQKLALKGGDVVKALFKMGVMATITQSIDHDTAALITEELGHKPVRAGSADAEDALLAHTEDEQGEKRSRPPVVTIMGHVDHGKTSLLDYIRRTKVASGEAGGITQHIGAYHVETDRGVISFLDTPGHAAFTSMRARGAKLTDIVVLVVAADDGVMPQTIEAVKHAKAAGVPLIVAVNKIDKSGADPLRVKNELLSQDVVAEEFGGDTQFVEVSAKTGAGIDTLLDAISLQAEVLELKAVFDGRASGVVIESSLDKGRGPMATVLVQQGSLKRGDYLVCGVQYGRVRALFDETGGQPAEAGPSIPVQVLGLSGVPDAGDDFVVVDDERLAKDVAQQRETKRRESRLVSSAGSRMEDIMSQLGKGEGQLSLNLVIKADVQGSVEALKQSLVALSNEQIRINVIHSGVGGITESDANSALASKATVIGFNVRADASARRIIETNGVDLRYFSIIYDVIDQVKQVASGLLGVEIREEIIGTAQVRDVFRSSKFGAVAGCMVIEGVVKRNKPIRVLRDNTVVFEGELESLRRFKENVDEVRNGTECGIGVKAYNDVKPGDQIECFERIEVQRTL